MAILISSGTAAQNISEQAQSKWEDSYEFYRTTIRLSDAVVTAKCENLLREILKTIDENNICESDDQCGLMGEDPFGPWIPVRNEVVQTLGERMREYKDICNNDTLNLATEPQFVHAAVCWKNKCTVRTSRVPQ